MNLFSNDLPDPFFPKPDWHSHAHITPPASKSLTNRLLVLAALAHGQTTLQNPLVAEDSVLLAEALSAAGISVDRRQEESWTISGGTTLVGGTQENPVRLQLGNAGTAMRFLTGLTALHGSGWFLLEGSERMHQRPLKPLLDALTSLGVHLECLGSPGCPPVLIKGCPLVAPAQVTVSGQVSSQYISSLLLNACDTPGLTLTIQPPVVSRPYIAMTSTLLRQLGVPIQGLANDVWSVPPNALVQEGLWNTEPDASSATYPLAAAALTGRAITVNGIGKQSLQGDIRFMDLLQQMGCRVSVGEKNLCLQQGASLSGFDFDFEDIPDTAMTAAVLAVFAQGKSRLRGLSTLRLKETDRVAAIRNEIKKLGAEVEVLQDDLLITPKPERYQAVSFETYLDHRMAMAFSLVSLRVPGCSVVDPACVAKSWPQYFQDMGMV